ncbi:hypothetical protein [Nonomuraea sp. KM90]|uniref:hypothetical protein n=1 Tax=Nonomuraea sp. KM90 TaxID=3457428 RepID=UPI003FCE3243
MPIAPAGEPERYVRLLISDRRYAGRGIGATLLAHAADETRQARRGAAAGRLLGRRRGPAGRVLRRQRLHPHPSASRTGQVLARRVA